MGLGRLTNNLFTHTNLHKPNNKLVSAQLEHFWCQDELRANSDSQDSPRLRLGGSHHLPPYSIFCAWPWDQHPNGILSWDSQVGVPKFPKLGLSQLWGAHNSVCKPSIHIRLKKIYSPFQELSNGMSHVTCTQRNWGDSQLLVVGNQTTNLTPNPSLGHNLCLKC